MREPSIVCGFIIFREGYEMQLSSGGLGHYGTARKWVQSNNDFQKLFLSVINDHNQKIFDYDDFLTDYVGAIRLYNMGEKLYCYIPRNNNCEYKSYLKNFYLYGKVIVNGQELFYHPYGETDDKPEYIPLYNRLLLANKNGEYFYNPNRIGD